MLFSSGHIQCTYCQHDLSLLVLTLLTGLSQCLSGFSIVKSTEKLEDGLFTCFLCARPCCTGVGGGCPYTH